MNKNNKKLLTLINNYKENIPERFLNDLNKVAKDGKYTIKLNNNNNIDKYDVRNRLNDLSGKEWVYFLNSIEETSYSVNGKESVGHKFRKEHPSPKPPYLMKKLIEFFTKKNQLVFDPFAGVGGTLLGASLSNRKAIGIELSSKYKNIYLKVCDKEDIIKQKLIISNSYYLDDIDYLKEKKFDFILTDPPYSDMLSRKKTGQQLKNNNDSSPTPFTESKSDLGNMNREKFLSHLKIIIKKSAFKLKNKGYIALFVKDLQPKENNLNMLHYEIANEINKLNNIYYKGMKIWYDKTNNLYPFGYPYAYVMNQMHQYILFFRKNN